MGGSGLHCSPTEQIHLMKCIGLFAARDSQLLDPHLSLPCIPIGCHDYTKLGGSAGSDGEDSGTNPSMLEVASRFNDRSNE